jgi:hypothetical protein
MQQVNLFGEPVDEFKSALERYGVWPITVWPVDHSDKYTKGLKAIIGDDPNDVMKSRHGGRGPNSGSDQFPGSKQASRSNANDAQPLGVVSRHNANPLMSTGANSVYTPGSTTHTSVFSPAVAAWLLNCYAPDSGLCLDPFAGGGTRAIMAAKHGLDYVGLEIRPEEVAAVRARLEVQNIGYEARIIEADARDCGGFGPANFLITCPPYYDLEMYGGGEADLSMLKTYEAFLAAMEIVIQGTHAALLPSATSCWVVGLHRDFQGGLLPLHHDIASLHRRAGFKFREEIILNQVNNGAIQRIGNFDKGQRHLIRTHEYALVFEKGL